MFLFRYTDKRSTINWFSNPLMLLFFNRKTHTHTHTQNTLFLSECHLSNKPESLYIITHLEWHPIPYIVHYYPMEFH